MTAYPSPAYAPPAYVAQLRVYEPLAAFPPGEREHWLAHAASGGALSIERGPQLERAAGLAAVVGLPPPCVPDLAEHAYVAEVDGVTLVCPLRTVVRSWEALAQVRAGLADVLVDALLPRGVLDAAEDALQVWRTDNPELRVHVRSSTWQVPVRWFVLFDAEECYRSPGAAGPTPATTPGSPPAASLARRTGRALVYRTPMSRARRRTARALAVLRRTLDDASATAGVEDLGRWLEEFHPRSLVELDYGGLVHLVDDDAMAEDESARDVAAAIAALGAGDSEAAGFAYARVTRRMSALQAVESAN